MTRTTKTDAVTIIVDALVAKLTSARKQTKDGRLETLVTLTVTLLNPSDEAVAQLIQVQGRDLTRATFAVLQQPLFPSSPAPAAPATARSKRSRQIRMVPDEP